MSTTATSITIRAAGEKARTIETQNQEHRAASGDEARGASVFDVWTHTKQGIDERGGIGGNLKERFIDAPPAVEEGLTGHWASASVGGTGQSIANQAGDVGQQFLGLFGKGDQPAPEGALAKVGAAFGLLISLEQLISAPLAMVPFPAFPAVRITDLAFGLPHGHSHPPTFGTPLPSIGPVIPIPILSGAVRTLINGLPAARCGDLGIGIWCGGYFPLYEIFLGSSSVWIEGARAARLFVDITMHCLFTVPKPTDPPIGPMFGFTITASPNVIIGGVPMPSLLSLAIGRLFRGIFRGIGNAINKIKAARAAKKAAEEAAERAAREAAEREAREAAEVAAREAAERAAREASERAAREASERAAREAAALPGHGHARHGPHTTVAEQTTRVQTGMAPDGQHAPTSRATRFDSPEAELDAVRRAQARTAQRVATGQQSTAIIVDSHGNARLPRDTSVVTGHPGGYGSGVEVIRDPATGHPLPGRPVQPTGQDPNALAVLEYNPSTGTWEPITQYPTNRPVTP